MYIWIVNVYWNNIVKKLFELWIIWNVIKKIEYWNEFFFWGREFFCELIVDWVNLILIRKYGFKIIVCVLCVYVL